MVAPEIGAKVEPPSVLNNPLIGERCRAVKMALKVVVEF